VAKKVLGKVVNGRESTINRTLDGSIYPRLKASAFLLEFFC